MNSWKHTERNSDKEESLDSRDKHWHLDKKVPVAIIAALIVQTTSIVWWAASLESKVDSNSAITADYLEQRERIVRLEAYNDMILKELRGIRGDLSEILRENRERVYD